MLLAPAALKRRRHVFCVPNASTGRDITRPSAEALGKYSTGSSTLRAVLPARALTSKFATRTTPTTELGGGNYVPALSLANFSSKAAHVTVQYAETSNGTSTAHDVQSIAVPPGQTRDLVLDNLQGDPDLQNSFLVLSDASPGDLLTKLISVTSLRPGEVEMLGKDQLDRENVGTQPWSIEDGTESTILLFNHSSVPQTFHVLISGSASLWQKDYELQSMETEGINIGDLIANKTKDDSGKTISADATSGEVTWVLGLHGVGRGRILQSNATTGMARSFSCGEYATIASANWTSQATSVPDGTTVDIGGIVAVMDLVYPYYCTGSYAYTGNSGGFLYTYSSSNTSILTAQSFGSNYTVNAEGMSDGNATMYGTVTDTATGCEGFAQDTESVVPSISQLPPILNMSSGDTNQTIDFSIIPNTIPLTVSFFTGMLSNPNSSNAATVSVPTIINAVGNESAPITVTGSNSPSGIFYALACATGSAPCAPIGTDIKIPPQILIQMMQAEAGGTNTTAMQAAGDVVRNRFGWAMFNPPYSTYQNTIIAGQFAFSTTPNGIEPELDDAVNVFTGSGSNFCGALAFWTPTRTQWATVQSAISSGTTTFPSGTGAPVYGSWPSSQQQILNVSSVGNQSNGAPNFLYLAVRGTTQHAAVSVSCSP